MKQRTYIAIDLKSFYASVECRERGLDPLDTNLVVADESRTEKTICLAVTPSLKSYGISGRSRLFEVNQRVREVNARRQQKAPGRKLEGSSHFFSRLQADPALAVDFLIAPPRMAYYMEYSTRIYQIYLKYIAPEDMVVYSIDEVFWRVGRGIAKKLEENGMFTMGDVALCSERNEDLLYKLFGKNAELLIDHAWGWEPTTIAAIKAYRPSSNSLSSGQVLHCPYEADKAKLVVREMTDLLVLDLVDKGLVTDQMALTVGYDVENLTDMAAGSRSRPTALLTLTVTHHLRRK